jgi:hypothetical protein
MKQTTWDTAGSGRDYDIYNFMDRVSGFEFDDSAIAWGCQLRELLRNRTGEADYVRPGKLFFANTYKYTLCSKCLKSPLYMIDCLLLLYN